jgi:hypothetical protein
MGRWNIMYSYKYDLASFCNLFTKSDLLIDLHREGYDAFKDKIDAKPEYVQLARQMQQGGFDPRLVLVSVFDLTDYEGLEIEKLCSILDDAEQRQRVHDHYVHTEQLVTEEMWQRVAPIIPLLGQMAQYAHHSGFAAYWKENCVPRLDRKARELQAKTAEYDIISEINQLLGAKYRLPLDTVTLQLSQFTAPFGSKLRNQSFLADLRWDLADIVAVALHEMIHPPFARGNMEEIARYLWEDDLLQEAYQSQPGGTPYNTPLRFLEEHLTEGAHLYLGEKLGVVSSPLAYLAAHDSGSHVISVLVYDYLKKGARGQADSFEEAVYRMIEKGILHPGSLRREYCRIYQEAGIKAPFGDGDGAMETSGHS